MERTSYYELIGKLGGKGTLYRDSNFFLTEHLCDFDLQKITVAECIETQSKAMTMLTIEQLSYLLKFAIQKMKQPGVRRKLLLV